MCRLQAVSTLSTDVEPQRDPPSVEREAPASADSASSPAADPKVEDVSPIDNGMDGYLRLQRRLVFATLLVIAMAVPLTAWRFGPTNALSLLMGGVAGMLYLRMLARNVARFGVASKTLGKSQLLVPVLLVLVVSRIPSLQVLPALVGFLLYKPAIVIQAVLDA
jgi:ATP synthase protein I